MCVWGGDNRHYAVWKADHHPEFGTLVVNAGAQEVELWVNSSRPPSSMGWRESDAGDLTIKTFSVLTWHIDLRDAGFIVAPMIWRCGACVRYRTSEEEDFEVGCICAHMDPGARLSV